jgi:predicted metalloprotease with PDZ domain
VAGNPVINEFDVEGSRHTLAYVGNPAQWDGPRAAREVEKVVREVRHFWGFLPFKKYVFLFRQGGGGGLEHLNSTLLSASASPNYGWFAFVCHEYFHAFNVKRLRPIELGPFNYENPEKTTGLWVSEGLTSYYGELLAGRAGLGTAQQVLDRLASHISSLQNNPGRLKQSLNDSSWNVWTTGGSGIGQGAGTVSYYVKGPVVGWLLDAQIRRATDGKKSLDDLMRLAYLRYSGERGFTADQFRATAEEVAGVDLKEWFRKALASTEELDYTEALDWFGLRFAPQDDQQARKTWKLEVRDDATDLQKAQLREWLGRASP